MMQCFSKINHRLFEDLFTDMDFDICLSVAFFFFRFLCLNMS